MAPRRAIGERLRRAGTLAVRREISNDWAANWWRDHCETVRHIELALAHGDIDQAGRYLGQLKALSGKAREALPRVFDALMQPDKVT